MPVKPKKTTKARTAKKAKKPAAKATAKKAKKAKKPAAKKAVAKKAVAKASPAKKTVKRNKLGKKTPSKQSVKKAASKRVAKTPAEKTAWKIRPAISQSVFKFFKDIDTLVFIVPAQIRQLVDNDPTRAIDRQVLNC